MVAALRRMGRPPGGACAMPRHRTATTEKSFPLIIVLGTKTRPHSAANEEKRLHPDASAPEYFFKYKKTAAND